MTEHKRMGLRRMNSMAGNNRRLDKKLTGTMPMPKLLPSASNEQAAEAALACELLPDGGDLREIRSPDGERAFIRRSELKHIVGQGRAGARDPREIYANLIVPTIRDPEEIWLAGSKKRLIKIFAAEDGGKPMLVILKQHENGFFLWTGYRVGMRRLNRQRRGTLLYTAELTVLGRMG